MEHNTLLKLETVFVNDHEKSLKRLTVMNEWVEVGGLNVKLEHQSYLKCS